MREQKTKKKQVAIAVFFINYLEIIKKQSTSNSLLKYCDSSFYIKALSKAL